MGARLRDTSREANEQRSRCVRASLVNGAAHEEAPATDGARKERLTEAPNRAGVNPGATSHHFDVVCCSAVDCLLCEFCARRLPRDALRRQADKSAAPTARRVALRVFAALDSRGFFLMTSHGESHCLRYFCWAPSDSWRGLFDWVVDDLAAFAAGGWGFDFARVEAAGFGGSGWLGSALDTSFFGGGFGDGAGVRGGAGPALADGSFAAGGGRGVGGDFWAGCFAVDRENRTSGCALRLRPRRRGWILLRGRLWRLMRLG